MIRVDVRVFLGGAGTPAAGRLAVPVCLVAAAALAFGFGCNRPGLGRHALRGKVTIGGQPMPAGEIMFEPDAARGGKGPGTIAFVKDGRYETLPGRGHAGGPHVLRIKAFDGKPQPEKMLMYGEELFHGYVMPAELPRASATFDITLPTLSEIKAGSSRR